MAERTPTTPERGWISKLLRVAPLNSQEKALVNALVGSQIDPGRLGVLMDRVPSLDAGLLAAGLAHRIDVVPDDALGAVSFLLAKSQYTETFDPTIYRVLLRAATERPGPFHETFLDNMVSMAHLGIEYLDDPELAESFRRLVGRGLFRYRGLQGTSKDVLREIISGRTFERLQGVETLGSRLIEVGLLLADEDDKKRVISVAASDKSLPAVARLSPPVRNVVDLLMNLPSGASFREELREDWFDYLDDADPQGLLEAAARFALPVMPDLNFVYVADAVRRSEIAAKATDLWKEVVLATSLRPDVLFGEGLPAMLDVASLRLGALDELSDRRVVDAAVLLVARGLHGEPEIAAKALAITESAEPSFSESRSRCEHLTQLVFDVGHELARSDSGF